MDDVWTQVRDKWGPEYHEEWPDLMQMVGGSPHLLLESRESIIARWPGLLKHHGPSHPTYRKPILQRFKRAWRVLVGTS